MKFSCYTKDLIADLKSVAKCADPKSNTPILHAVKIVAEDGKIILSATNHQIAAQATIPAHIEVEGTVCVDARYLVEVVGKLSDEVSTFAIDEHFLKVTSGGSEFDLLMFDPQDYPRLDFPSENTLKIRMSAFKEMLRKTIFAASNDDDRPVFKGVNLKFERNENHGELQAAATNIHRLMVYRHVFSCDDAANFNIVVPANYLRNVESCLSAGDNEFVWLSPDEKSLTVKFDNVCYRVRLIAGDFPPLDRILCDPNRNKEATFLTAEMKNALNSASVVAKEDKYKSVTFEFFADRIQISAQSETRGNFNCNVAANCDAELKAYFNFGYLLDFLSVADCTKLLVKYSGAFEPIEISGVGDPFTFTYIVTPVRH